MDETTWRPVPELPYGHYAEGKLLHGGEARIYNAGGYVIDVANGHKVLIVGWKPIDVHVVSLPFKT